MRWGSGLVAAVFLASAPAAFAQHEHPPQQQPSTPSQQQQPPPSTQHQPAQATPGMMMHGMDMTGVLGPYPMSREASGTSWQPDVSEHWAS